MPNTFFEVIARAFVMRDGKILVCKNKTKDYYFLPGGHVEKNETVAAALIREIREEIGVSVVTYTFIGAGENIFSQNGEDIHEFNFVFDVEIENSEISSQESHLEVKWLGVEEFESEKIFPESMQKAVIKFLEDKSTFFITNL